jgi:hypothetical protein
MNRFIKHTLALILSISAINTFAQKAESDYGIGLNVNFPMIGLQTSDYSGRGVGGAHIFTTAPMSNLLISKAENKFWQNLNYHLSAGFAMMGIRDRQSDNRYTNTYIDGTASLYLKPFHESSDFKIFAGLRPNYLVSTNTEKLRDGEYVIDNIDSANQNKSGDIGFSGTIGISVALSSIVNLELKYNHSFDNISTSPASIKGRQSIIEVTLSISATGIRDKVNYKDISTFEYLKKLHKGNLMVMLPTVNKAEIDGLINAGKSDQITNLLDELHQANVLVMKAFKNEFDFCPVVFYDDTNAYKVSNKVFGDFFYDADGNSIAIANVNTANFFVASFCEDVSSISHKMDYGLYVYDDKITHLGKPFNTQQNQFNIFAGGDPLNYLRKRLNVLSYEDYSRKVKKLNGRLLRFSSEN